MSFELQESFDVYYAKTLLYSKKLDELEASKLRVLLRAGKGGDLTVKYTDTGIGRLKSAALGGKKGEFVPHFMCGISGIVRKCISGRKVHDIDIACCHATLLLKVTKDHGLPHKRLEEYVAYYKGWRDMVAGECKVTVDVAKDLFSSILYGGSPHVWAKDNNVDPKCINSAVEDLQRELKGNLDSILAHYPECIEHQKTAKPDHWNPRVSAMSFVLGSIEKKCLLAMKESFERRGRQVESLIHDGLTITRKEDVKGFGDEEICTTQQGPLTDHSPDLLSYVESDIFKKTGFKVKLVEKDMSSDLLDGREVTEVDNDNEAADEFIAHYTDVLKKDNGRTFILEDGVWSYDNTKEKLLKMCLDMDIVKVTNRATGEYEPYSKNVATAERIVKAVIAKLPTTIGFVKSLFDSNLGYLVFKNGVYNFKVGEFQPFDKYPDLKSTVRTTLRIERDFPDRDSLKEKMQWVEEKVLEPILPNKERREYFLQSSARGLAGHIEDKEWTTCLGERNGGKGVIVGCFEEAFEGYIGQFNADAFLYKTNVGDAAKDKSWMLDHEFKRLIFSNECTIDQSKGLKLNGGLIKNFSSGGDNLVARKNYKDEISFRVQCKMFLMANDLPPIRPPDALQFMTNISFETVFTEEWKEGMLPHIRAADPSIKATLRNDPQIKDAFLLMVLESYLDRKPVKMGVVKEDTDAMVKEESFEEQFNEYYEITGVEEDRVLRDHLLAKFKGEGSGPRKISLTLKKLGVNSAKSNGKTYYLGIKERPYGAPPGENADM
jgi:hypothetical protein